ncbi:MAG: aminotransferase class V-fold PLP-dependent enzyme [Tunicatimonas sp.]
MDITNLRKNYPALAGRTYLNTASCGLVSKATAAAAQQFYQELLEQGGAPRNEWYAQVPLLRQEVADWLGAEAEEVALLPNFSVACNYVAQALTGHSRVLLLDSDYSSLTLPWLLPDYRVHYFSATPNGTIDLNGLEEQVKKHRIEVLAISHVQYASGYCVDLEVLSRCCRDWGVLLVVDATQSLGVVPIDLRAAPVDVLIGSGYKWMTAGYGNALLFVRRALHDRLRVPAVGNNSFDDSPTVRSRSDLQFSARLLEVGHYDFASLRALQQAVRELQAIGQPAIHQRVQALVAYLHGRLPTLVEMISDYAPAHRSGITVLRGGAALERALLKENIITSARPQGLRISLHFYNNKADIDRLCQGLVDAS